jgi:FRG domain
VSTSHEADYRAYVELISARAIGDRAHLDDVVRHPERGVQLEDLGLIAPDDVARARALAPAWQAARAADRMSTPFADAYQAGFWLHLTEDQYFRYAKPDKAYRGQRDATWPTSASLFRNDDRSPAPEHRRRRLISLATRLRDRLGCEAREAFAATQHYGGEAGTVGGLGPATTWLLDVTWNPFIALAFATHGGRDGDVGVVSCVDVREWRAKLGAIADLVDLVELDLPRPQQQEAAFIDSAFPELADDYLPLSFCFEQHSDLVFDDASVNASMQSIYPQDDPTIQIVKEWAQQELLEGSPPELLRALPLPDRARLRQTDAASGWVPFTVFRDAATHSLGELTHHPDADSEPLAAHIELLAVFHSQARYHKLRPGLGALGDGAWIAYDRSRHGQPPSLREMTMQYNLVYEDAFRALVHRVEELWDQAGSAWTAARRTPITLDAADEL